MLEIHGIALPATGLAWAGGYHRIINELSMNSIDNSLIIHLYSGGRPEMIISVNPLEFDNSVILGRREVGWNRTLPIIRKLER